MKRSTSAVLLLLLSPLAVSAQTPGAPTAPLSPAQQGLALAKAVVEKNPDHVQHHNDLASAFVRRARETPDPLYYEQAEAALQRSFRLAPDNFDGHKIRVQILLGQHEFARGLELAQELNRRVGDDIAVYGMIADACIELGDYRQAEEAVEWMLKLRQSGASVLARVALLRQLFGDIDGAFEMMNAAHEAINPGEVEERARNRTQAARLALTTGNVKYAEKLLQQALKLLPEYHHALVELARVRTLQQRHPEAIDLWRRVNQHVPHPRNLYGLANALQQAGRVEEAKRAAAEFEGRARGLMKDGDNANRELVFYYADYARKPAEALRIARLEVARRRDVHTLDAYAWALYVNRDYREARRQIERALGVGIRDANLFYHAGSILTKLDDRRVAAIYLQQSLDLNPLSESAKFAHEALAKADSFRRRPGRR